MRIFLRLHSMNEACHWQVALHLVTVMVSKVRVMVKVNVKVTVSFSIVRVETEHGYFWCITVLTWRKRTERYLLDRKVP